ncbi:methylated-DNA-[protein]-cysteine S-methyltransferase [Oxalobacteraceae bacterium GrIS 2.11]
MNQTIRFCAVIEAPFGVLGIRTESGVLQELVYLPANYALSAPASALSKKVVRQLEHYFDNPGFQFDLPLSLQGTAHQHKVWKAISSIPIGQVATYGQIAKLIGSAPRAVGQACGANYYPLIIPCHRVTAANGLGGFANQDDADGYALSIKRWLLKHEGVHGY